jgi:hypothetical protein
LLQGSEPETQTQFPSGPASQNDPTGQVPPHSGTVLLPHGTPTQAQTPPTTTHCWSSGQRPPHAGVDADEHGRSNGAQTQAPLALGRHVCEVGQAPSHVGAAADPHAVATGTQEQLVPEERHSKP